MATSYRDPVWDQIEKKVAADVGIPASLLRDIRTKGERSNSDQVSEAGARTVYQVIPSTREALRKKHGVDAYANPESAARAAALLLKESLIRNKGDQAAAAGEYHGGTNRSNWGKRTRAYIERVTGRQAKGGDRSSGGGSTFDRVKAQREARESAGPSISKVYEAYKSGRMAPQDAAQFENDVNEGRVMLPRGASLKKTPAAPVLPAGVIQAYNSHEMAPEERAQVDQDLRDGLVSLPRDAKLQAPAPRTTADLLGMGTRNVMEGAGSLVDVVAGPLNALVNALPGEQGLSTTPFRDLARSGADVMGFAQPESASERLNSAIIEGGTAGLASAGAGAALAPMRGATGAVGRALASAPATDIASGAAAGGAAELARQSGAGPLGQLAAGLAGGGAAVGGAVGAQRAVNRALLSRAKTADEVVAAAPREEIFDRAGNLTDEGREIVIQRDIAPDDLRAAYDQAPPGVRAGTANDAAPDAGARAVAVGDDVPPPRVVDEPDIRPAARAPEATPLPATAAARLAEAQSEGVPLTRGQATQEFEAQDAEQTLRAAASKEGAAAREFDVAQVDKIKEATARFESALGDRTMNATERGQAVKDAIRDLKEEGRQGVQALYKAAADTPGHDIPIPRDAILDEADRLILDTPMEQGSKDALERALAKYGLLGENVETSGRYRSVVTDDGRKITIRGEVEPLTLKNAETFRQALNAAWDQKGLMGGAVRALDKAVDDILEKTATSERNDLFKEARAASRQQKQTFEAKDVVQNLADWKKGTRTDVVLPEQAIAKIFSGGKEGLTNLKKIKALLLSKPTEKSRAAWQAVKAQGVGDIFKQAYTTNANLGGGGLGAISGAKLNSAIEKFGPDKLKVLLDESEFNQLMKLRRIIGNATIPIKNTTNPSGSGFKVMNFLAPFASKLSPLMPYGLAIRELVTKGADIRKAQQTIKGITEFGPEAAAKASEAAPKGKAATAMEAADRAANEFIQTFIETAGSGRLLAPVLAATPSEGDEQ